MPPLECSVRSDKLPVCVRVRMRMGVCGYTDPLLVAGNVLFCRVSGIWVHAPAPISAVVPSTPRRPALAGTAQTARPDAGICVRARGHRADRAARRWRLRRASPVP